MIHAISYSVIWILWRLQQLVEVNIFSCPPVANLRNCSCEICVRSNLCLSKWRESTPLSVPPHDHHHHLAGHPRIAHPVSMPLRRSKDSQGEQPKRYKLSIISNCFELVVQTSGFQRFLASLLRLKTSGYFHQWVWKYERKAAWELRRQANFYLCITFIYR